MCQVCQQEIFNFRNRHTPASPWTHLDRKIVADRLQEILWDPNTLQQGAIGFCGIAVFLRVWTLNDHLAVARFAIQLFETGQGIIGQDVIKADSDLMDCDYPNILWLNDQGDPSDPCPQADWLMMSTIQEDSNIFFDFKGAPGHNIVDKLPEGWGPSNIVNYLNKTQLFQNVNDETALIPANIGFLKVGAEQATYLFPSNTIDYILMINSNLIEPWAKDKGFWGFYQNNTSNHFIGLETAPYKVFENGDEFIQMGYFSWGSLQDGKFPYQDFDDNYYGDIAAGAKQPKIPLPVPPAPDAPTITTAFIADDHLTIEWSSSSPGDRDYLVERASSFDKKVQFKGFRTAAARRPSSLGGEYREDVSKGNGLYWYRIKARNVSGQSGPSHVVMATLPNGPVRIVHPSDSDITLPPPYVAQVTVLRALPGRTPSGYARLPDEPCDCLRPEVIYNANWEPFLTRQRALKVLVDQPLKPDRAAYIFIRFENDTDWPGQGIPMDDVSLVLTLLPIGASSGNIPTMLQLKRCTEPGRCCYWAEFTPQDLQAPYSYSFHIEGADAFDHYVPRKLYQYFQGPVLDRNPASAAWPNLNDAPLYPIQLYLQGGDNFHHMQIGTVTHALAPDQLEPNNAFAKATPVAISSAAGLVKKYSALSLHAANDADYFQVDYLPTSIDNASTLLEPTKEWLSRLLGLYIMHYPPLLEIALFTDHKACVDLALYKSDAVTQTHNLPKQGQISLYNPSLTFFLNHRFYLTVKNSDFNQQGAFAYQARFSYQHAYDEPNVDCNAPAYQPKTSVGRAVLKQIYDKIDLPRPAEDWKVHRDLSINTFVEQTAGVLLNRQTVEQVQAIFKSDYRRLLADDYRLAAAVATRLDLAGLAKKLNQAANAMG
jgi:hypothetical protein